MKTKIYIENYLSRKDIGIAEYTIDFKSKDEAQTFLSSINPEIEYSSFKFYKLITPYHGRNRMIRGSWYNLPNILFQNASYSAIDENTEGSSVYTGEITVKNIECKYSNYLTNVNIIEYPTSDFSQLKVKSLPKKVIIVNCGEGNWNEIYFDKELLIYDIGASVLYSQSDVKNLINSRFSNYSNKKINIIISHWDMDHFQSLKYLTPKQLKNINAVYGPNNIPNTNVYNDTINNLTKNRVKYYSIPPTVSFRKRFIDLNLLKSVNNIDIYRSTKGKSINQSGIVLIIKGKNKLAILTGDHHYPKIFNAIKNKYTKKDAIFVIPHHGGKAGRLVTSDWQSEFSDITCAISVGKNIHNHPNQNIKNIEKLHKYPPDRTDKIGDITYNL